MEADDDRRIVRMQISEYILFIDQLGLETGPRAATRHYENLIIGAAGYLASLGQDVDNDDPTLDTSPLINGLSTCVACTERFRPYRLFKALCPHWYCQDCINQLVVASLQDAALHPPRCCNIPFDLQSFRHLLTEERAVEFERKAVEFADQEPRYCYHRDCGTYIPPNFRHNPPISNPFGRCPACRRATCLHCRNAWHQGACVQDAEDENVRGMVRQEGGQECPQCHSMIVLRDGCNHITCHCRYQFCFICTARWRTCRCPQYNGHPRVVNRPREQEREQRREQRREARNANRGNAINPRPIPAVPLNVQPRAARPVNHQHQPVQNLPLNVHPRLAQPHALPAPIQFANIPAVHHGQVPACQHTYCFRRNGRQFCNGCEQTWPEWAYECNGCHERYCAQCLYERNGHIPWFDPEVVRQV